MKILGALLLLLALQAQAVPLTIVPNGAADLVTTGIPFAPCLLKDVSAFQLSNADGVAVPVFIKSTMSWPASKCDGVASVRAVKVQFHYDPVQGVKEYDWQLSTRSLPDLAEAPVAEFVSSNPARAGFKEPAFFAISAPDYLVTTGLTPPTNPASTSAYDTDFFPKLFTMFSTRMNFAPQVSAATATKTSVPANTLGLNAADWLFDRVSTIYQQALRTGDIEYYRDAYLSHEFWLSRMEVTGTNTRKGKLESSAIAKDYCLGGFDFGGRADTYESGGGGCDSKYIYLTPWKLHLALTGDDSWTPAENGVPSPLVDTREKLLNYIGTKAIERAGVSGFKTPYVVSGAFTERDAGFALQDMVAGYELTGSPQMLADIKTAVGNLYNMATKNPDGLGSNGYMSHSWDKHEGWYPGYLGMTTQAYTNATTIVISDLLNDTDWQLLSDKAQIESKPYKQPATFAARPVKNADGTLTLTLSTAITLKADEYIQVMSNGTGTPRVYAMIADRAFSPWMQAILADALWQLYHLTDDADLTAKSAELLLGFGRAVTAYGIDGFAMSASTKALIESAFGVTVVNSKPSAGRGVSPYVRYVANAAMSGAPAKYIEYMMYDGGFSDQHSPEAIFQIALGMYFETDPAKKAAMQAVSSDLLGWFENPAKTISTNHPPRILNWGNKPDPWGTYDWVTNPAHVLPPRAISITE